MAKQSKVVFPVVGLAFLWLSTAIVWSKESKGKPHDEGSSVEVRAVFINCIPDEREDNPNNELLRFERQELFKHNALRNCNKKLALTVKLTTEPNVKPAINTENLLGTSSLEDEYIPIDHVFEGLDKKRVRLLNPYILRLRREPPRQVYKLHRIDTVTGILTSPNFGQFTRGKKQSNREARQTKNEAIEIMPMMLNSEGTLSLDHNDPEKQSFSIHVNPYRENLLYKGHFTPIANESNEYDPYNLYSNMSVWRNKRQIQIIDQKPNKFRSYKNRQHLWASDNGRKIQPTQDFERDRFQIEDIDELSNEFTPVEVTPVVRHSTKEGYITEMVSDNAWTDSPEANVQRDGSHTASVAFTARTDYEPIDEFSKKGTVARDFALYEIGVPDLWYDLSLQLFEKTSTPEGKTVWNDWNNGEQASVNTTHPEWKSKDMNVAYKPSEWIPREDFVLPPTKLCLLEPLKAHNYSADDDYLAPNEPNANFQYIVVPAEDVIYLSEKPQLMNQENETEDIILTSPDGLIEESRSRVEVRVARAITGGGKHKFEITTRGSEQFLSLPHWRPHHAQIDLEVKADDNQLVRVGSSGRLPTIVTDSSRKTRSTIHVQATNTGLASAKFKVMLRECGPELDSLLKEKNSANQISTGPILLPPQHTQRLRLEVPMEIPVGITKCNVALVNDEDESVAVREVTIKKGDRCFCVWHCDCVCLGDDPKLICREMSQPQQVAAGLSGTERKRFARDVFAYKDSCVCDVSGLVCGILTVLLVFGCIKAVLGLHSSAIGVFGLDHILKSPRHLDCYYEDELRSCCVVYDENGWPIHPRSGFKTVRVVDRQTEFLINMIFFVAIVGIFMCSGLRKLMDRFMHCATKAKRQMCGANVYSASDLQGESMELVLRRRLRKQTLRRRWMSPEAEELTDNFLRDETDIRCTCAQKIYESRAPCDDKCFINQANLETRPLLLETNQAGKGDCTSFGDSEQEDTDYVLMQMQKSRESLAKSRIHEDTAAHSTEKALKIKSENSNTNTTLKK